MHLLRLLDDALRQASELWHRLGDVETITAANPPPRILARIHAFVRKLTLNP